MITFRRHPLLSTLWRIHRYPQAYATDCSHLVMSTLVEVLTSEWHEAKIVYVRRVLIWSLPCDLVSVSLVRHGGQETLRLFNSNLESAETCFHLSLLDRWLQLTVQTVETRPVVWEKKFRATWSNKNNDVNKERGGAVFTCPSLQLSPRDTPCWSFERGLTAVSSDVSNTW